MFFQLLVNGLIAGAIYSLIATGFSIIYSTCRFAHFAHGAVAAFAGYILFTFYQSLGLDFWLSSFLAIISAAFLGYFLNLTVYKQLRKRKATSAVLLIASIALLILIESLILLFWGANIKTINFIEVAPGIEKLGAIITPLQITIILISVILYVGFLLFMKRTKLGKTMRAVADNKDVAEIVGISAEKIYSLSFTIGSAIAGLAGILIALEQNLNPTMGTGLMIKGFTGAIIGGIGSVPGAILGSYILGLAENFGIWFLPSGYKDAIAFVLLFLFLLFKPQGILTIKRGLQK